MTDFPGVRLHVVTGKGGTGKTTVAAALALALASGGRRVLLVEVEERQGIAQLFDVPPLPYEERSVAVAPGGGGEVFALAVDAEMAMVDYLHLFYKVSPNGVPARALRRMGAIEFATTIAPGLRDVLLTGKVKEAVTRRRNTKTKEGPPAYDAVVLDAPPTGRIGRFLNISHEVGGLARMGPIKTQSDGVMRIFRSEQMRVHLVTLLEEMPVQETADAVAELARLGLHVGGVIVNAVRNPMLSAVDLKAAEEGQLDLEAVAAGLTAGGLEPTEAVVDGLAELAAEHAVRVGLEEAGRDRLAELGLPTYELPLITEPIDLGVLYALAEALAEQGLA